MDAAAQWPQGIGMEPSRRPRPEKDKQALNCPRCKSTNTKFCYYNNYSLTQPRYFCKSCRRYWTAGGSLRNVPVGGCTRKNKRSSTSSSSPSPSKQQLPHHPHDLINTPNSFPQPTSQNPKTITHDQGQDLNLAYPPPSTTCNDKYTPFSSFYPSGFPMQELKPSFSSVSADGYYGNLQGVIQESSGGGGGGARLFFPVEDLKLQPSIISSNYRDGFVDQQNIIRGGGEGSGYWSGMLGGGGTWLA